MHDLIKKVYALIVDSVSKNSFKVFAFEQNRIVSGCWLIIYACMVAKSVSEKIPFRDLTFIFRTESPFGSESLIQL